MWTFLLSRRAPKQDHEMAMSCKYTFHGALCNLNKIKTLLLSHFVDYNVGSNVTWLYLGDYLVVIKTQLHGQGSPCHYFATMVDLSKVKVIVHYR